MAYKLKIGPSQGLKLKGQAGFALPMIGRTGIKATKTGGIWYVDLDYTLLSPGPVSDAATAIVAVLDQSAGIYKEVSLASLLTSGLDADLQAIAALTSNGILVRTADDTWALRTLTGTANEITVTNGDGVAGNPVVSLPAALTFTGKTVTGGTFAGLTITTSTYNGNTWTAGTGTLTIAAGKSLTASNDATVSGTNTGDQTIALTGDVTGTGTGSFATAIGATKVTSSMLNADVFSTAHSWSGVQTFTDPVVSTQAAGDNSTKAASTAFVTAAVVAAGGGDMLASNNLSDVADVDAARANLNIHVPAGHIVGIKVENNTTDANNDLDFDDGECASDEAEPVLLRHTAGTAQIDVAYGTGNGGRFDSADAAGTWHCFVISNGTIVSRGFSQSLDPTSAPNYPSGYTHYRRVGSRVRVGTTFASTKQIGKRCYLQFPNAAYNTTPVAAKTAVAVRVPSGIPVVAIFSASIATASGSSLICLFPDPDQDDAAPSVTVAPGADLVCPTITSTVGRAAGMFERRTDGSGNIYHRASAASGNLLITTLGWIDDLIPD